MNNYYKFLLDRKIKSNFYNFNKVFLHLYRVSKKCFYRPLR